MNKNNTIGTKIRNLRIANKLSQDAFGKKINRERSVISSYENGRRTPSIETLIAIKRHFCPNEEDLFKSEIAGSQSIPTLTDEDIAQCIMKLRKLNPHCRTVLFCLLDILVDCERNDT